MNQVEEAQAAIKREDYNTAIQLLRPLEESGLAEAQYLLGSLHFESAAVDPRESHDWLRRAAEQDHPPATYLLWVWQDETVFAPPTEDYYHSMLLRAAELGSVDAWSVSGCLYATGDYGFPQDGAIARQWYLRAAERGDAYANTITEACSTTARAARPTRRPAWSGFAGQPPPTSPVPFTFSLRYRMNAPDHAPHGPAASPLPAPRLVAAVAAEEPCAGAE